MYGLDPAKQYDVTGIGNAILDVLGFVDDDFIAKEGMRKGDMALIDDARAQELYAHMGQTREVSGGSVANSQAGLAMLGAKTAFIGRVFDDQFGKLYTHDMKAVGVDFVLPAMTSGNPTGVSYIVVTPDGERTMNTYLGAGSEIYAEDIDEELIKNSKIVFGEGYQWCNDHNIDALVKAFKIAKETGGKTAFTLSAAFVVDQYREQFLEVIPEMIDILFLNEDEAAALYPGEPMDVIIEKLKTLAPIVALTLGKQGSKIFSGDQVVDVAPKAIVQIKDATGAGDLYAAGFLYGIVRNMPLKACGDLGSACAAQIIQQLGARAEQPLDSLVA